MKPKSSVASHAPRKAPQRATYRCVRREVVLGPGVRVVRLAQVLPGLYALAR